MKNNILKTRLFVLAFSLIALISVTSCGESGDDAKTPKEETIAALEGSWTLSPESNLANLGIDPSSVDLTITQAGFSLSGGIAAYVDGGSFSIDDEGNLTDLSVNITSEDLVIDGTPTITLDDTMTEITVSFNTVEAPARTAGIGSFVLIFVKA